MLTFLLFLSLGKDFALGLCGSTHARDPRSVVSLVGRYPLPNLIELIANQMEHTTPPVRLTRKTLLEVFRRAQTKDGALENPQEFATEVVRILKEALADQLVNGIRYEKIDDWFEMTQFDTKIESWEEYLVPARHSIYDHVAYQSQIERNFVEGLEKLDYVKLYVKLPNWFTVPTPVGEYNPDWAIVLEERDPHGKSTGKELIYLVRETKDKDWRKTLRPSERRKVICGERHFKGALRVDFKVVSQASDVR